MATVQISIGPNGCIPDSSGDCFFQPLSACTGVTNDVWSHLVALFNDTATDIKLHGVFTVPQDYSAGAVFRIKWTSDNGVNTGDVVWGLAYRTVAGDDAASIDQAGTEASPEVTDAAPGTDNFQLIAAIDPTDAHFAAGETVQFYLYREGTNGADTMAARAILVELLFEYTTA